MGKKSCRVAAAKQLLNQQQQALETDQPGNVPVSKLDHTT